MHGKHKFGVGPVLTSLALAWVTSAAGVYAQAPAPGVPPVRVRVQRVENPIVRATLQPLFEKRHRHTATALLRVAVESSIPPGDGSAAAGSFDVYRSTQQELLKSRFVLSAALKDPEIAKLAAVRGEADPVAWLARELRVDFPNNSQIMQVSLGDDDAAGAARLVNAVVGAYLETIVGLERRASNETRDVLDNTCVEMSAELRKKREDLQRLCKVLGTGSGEVSAMKRQIALEELAEYRREALRIELELVRAEVLLNNRRQSLDKLRPGEDSDDPPDARKTAELRPREVEVGELELEIEVLSTQRDLLQKHVAEKREDAEQVFANSIECEMLRAEIERMAESLDRINQQREALMLKANARPRVTLLQKAAAAQTPE